VWMNRPPFLSPAIVNRTIRFAKAFGVGLLLFSVLSQLRRLAAVRDVPRYPSPPCRGPGRPTVPPAALPRSGTSRGTAAVLACGTGPVLLQ